MSTNIKQAQKRPVSSKGQITIPHEFREDVKAYIVQEESHDEEGNLILTLYPITEDSEM